MDNAIENYINNLLIEEDCILNEIRKVIMAVDGIVDINITEPSGNTSIGNNQIARTGIITITFV